MPRRLLAFFLVDLMVALSSIIIISDSLLRPVEVLGDLLLDQLGV